MLFRLSFIIGLFFGGIVLAGEPGQDLQSPISGLGERLPSIPSPGEGLEKILGLKPTVQIVFNKPVGAKIYWDVTKPGTFDSSGLSIPGRQTFPANAIYRLRVTDISGHKGDEFFPTLEIGPIARLAEKFLADNAIPVQFRSEDLDRASRGETVTKVVYLPDEEFAELALEGVDTLVSFLLDPGVDPITEADRRGAILAVVRLSDVKLAARPADAVAASANSELAITAGPASSPPRIYRARRGWLRRR